MNGYTDESDGETGSSARIGASVQDTGQRWLEWFFFDGSRLWITTIVAIGSFVVFAVVTWSGIAPLWSSQPLYYVFVGLVSGNQTMITVVVSINQLLLFRELGTPDELESQMKGVIEYRSDVEDAAGRIAPVEPLDFLRLLVENTSQQVQNVTGMGFGNGDRDVYRSIDGIVSDLTEQMDTLDELLQESSRSAFEVLSVTLTTNYTRQINGLRRIRHSLDDDRFDDLLTALDDLINRLRRIDIARQYFKSLYFRRNCPAYRESCFTWESRPKRSRSSSCSD